ncbi:MAG: hypothetical protein sL5_05420 [Candidatus Mesenet longicola]|uniref:Uncharacterized protein n=1 Tax=Candidatus Mesenet longicola TaxID=1892558 RepID=A0A8J3HV33_9RICK|nr:MAG: hypothetical protein sGL2_05590 [Candidatus Mesenet longicola]GHM59549.1 MAG: hypothetical protein sL5_05420 [Candidatus Mesenet longicola]
MVQQSGATEETRTISEIIVKRLNLKEKELKDFESAFETLGIDLLVDHPSYEKRFSRDIRDSIYDSLSSIYKKSALARPLFLKYILDKERNFIEEVITKEFLKSLVGKFKQCYENNIKSLEQKIDNLENDKSNPSEQRLRKLQLSCEQYSAQVQAEINQVNRLIETVKSYLLQFQTYDNCSDIIGAREEILSYTKQCNHNILCNMLSPKIEEGFKGYLKQLGVQLDAQEVKSMYNRIKKNCNDQREIRNCKKICVRNSLILCGYSIALPPLAFVVLFGAQAIVRLVTLGDVGLMSYNTFKNLMYGSLGISAALLSAGLLLLPTAICYNHIKQKSLLNLNREELCSTSELAQVDQDQNNLSNENSPIPTAPPASEMENAEKSNAEFGTTLVIN